MRAVLPFAVMCVGMFIALLDIQIVASSLADIGGGLSAAQDEISWVQTAYLIAEIIMIPLSGWLTRVFSTRWLFTASAIGFTADQHAVRHGMEHRQHDRVPRTARNARRVDDPDRVHLLIPLLSRTEAGVFGGCGGHDRLHRTDPGTGDRRLDHRHRELALAVLRERGAGIPGGARRGGPGRYRQARLVAAEGGRLSRHRAAGYRARHHRICAGGRIAVELV